LTAVPGCANGPRRNCLPLRERPRVRIPPPASHTRSSRQISPAQQKANPLAQARPACACPRYPPFDLPDRMISSTREKHPKTLRRARPPGQHHGLECLGIRDELLLDLTRLSAGDDFLVGVGRDCIEGVRDELLRRHAGLWHSSRSHSVSVCTARTPTTCRPASPVPQAQRECCE